MLTSLDYDYPSCPCAWDSSIKAVNLFIIMNLFKNITYMNLHYFIHRSCVFVDIAYRALQMYSHPFAFFLFCCITTWNLMD